MDLRQEFPARCEPARRRCAVMLVETSREWQGELMTLDAFDPRDQPYVVRFESRPEDASAARGWFGAGSLDTRPPLSGPHPEGEGSFARLFESLKKNGVLEVQVAPQFPNAIRELRWAASNELVMMWSVSGRRHGTSLYIWKGKLSPLRWTSNGGLFVTINAKEVDLRAAYI